jgi:hypothetical protein
VHMGPTSPTRPCSCPAWRPKAAAHFHLPFLLLSLRGRAHSLAGHFPLPRRARGSPCITASPSSLRFKALALMAFKAELHALALTALSRSRSLPIKFHAVPFSPLCCCRSSPQPRYPVLSPRSSDAIAIAAGKPHRISQRLQVPLPLHFSLQWSPFLHREHCLRVRGNTFSFPILFFLSLALGIATSASFASRGHGAAAGVTSPMRFHPSRLFR